MPPHRPTDWRHLYDLSARQALQGPLTGSVQLALYDRGVGVRHDGMLRRKGDQGASYFPYHCVQGLPGGDTVELRRRKEDSARYTLSGKGARILSKVLGILDPARQVPVVGALADGISPVGLPIRGIALGGARGIVLIPGGLAGLVPNAALTLPLESLDAAVWDAGALALEVSSALDPRVRIQGDHLTPTTFGDWWAAALGPAEHCDEGPLEVLWTDDDRVLSPAQLELVEGGVVVQATGGPPRSLRSAGLWLEADGAAAVVGGSARIQLRVRGVGHTLWLRGGPPASRALSQHLGRCRLSAWPEDFDARAYRRCVGRWSAARVMVPGKHELVLRRPLVVSAPTGLVLCCIHLDGTRLRPLPRGRRVKVELLDDRAGLSFASIVLDQAPHCIECGGCDAKEAGQVLALFPTQVPERRTSRRARHRIEVIDEVPVQLRVDDAEHPWPAQLHNLSSEGAGVTLNAHVPPLGAVVELRLPIENGRLVKVRAEVLHATPDGPDDTRLGLRFACPTERMRALFQREVLRLERHALAMARVEGVEVDDIAPQTDAAETDDAEWEDCIWRTDAMVDLT